MSNKICNSCGKQIGQVEGTGRYNDSLEVKKEWGYFSGKDLETHSICICEACYDRWIKTFIISVRKEETKEIFKF